MSVKRLSDSALFGTPGYQSFVGATAPLEHLEAGSCYIYGHSFFAVSNSAAHRIGQRSHMTLYPNAVAGYTMAQTLAKIQSTWTVDNNGLVILCAWINDSNGTYPASHVQEAFRSCLAYLTAKVVLPYTDTSFAFGSGWSTGTTSTLNSYVDVAWTGDTTHLLMNFVTGSGGSVNIIDSGTGVTKSVSTGGYSENFTGAVRLSGYGAGPHTVRVKLTAGTVTVVGQAVLGTSPPTVVHMQEGPIPAYDANPTKQALLTTGYPAACNAVAATFPSVIVCPAGPGWSEAAMTGVDGTHPNSLGRAYYANQLVRALSSITHRQGLADMTIASPTASPAYTGATPNWVSSPTVPDAPTGFTVTPGDTQNVLNWSAAANNGSTITAYKVYRSTSSGTETLLTTLGAVTTYTDTSLTNGTTYYYKVSAVNGIGEGAQSSEASGTPQHVTVPDAPTGVSAVAGVGTATVSFTPPANNGGSTITGYTVTSSPGGFTRSGTSSPLIVVDLDPGTAYTFTVHATNAVGNSVESSASGSVTTTASLARDKFNRADASTLGTADQGGAWTAPNVGIVSNRAVGKGNLAQNDAVIDVATSNQTVSARMYDSAGNGTASLVARYTDANNFYMATARSSGDVLLSKMVGGSSTNLGSGGTLAQGSFVQLSVSGTTIKVYVDGVQVASVTDSSLTTGTKAGMRIFHTYSTVQIDDWSVS